MTRKDIKKAVEAGARWRALHPEQARAQRLAGTAASNRWREEHPQEAQAIIKDAHAQYMQWRIEQPEEARAAVIKGARLRQAQGPRVTNTSGFKGVYWDKRKGKWAATITVNGKHQRLGYFRSKHAAARAYNKAARRAFGKHAYQNPIPGPARRRASVQESSIPMKFY
jgi:hypothetical protein